MFIRSWPWPKKYEKNLYKYIEWDVEQEAEKRDSKDRNNRACSPFHLVVALVLIS